MSTLAVHILLKLAIFWALFLVLHFSYQWFPRPVMAVFSATCESLMQHAKIGFFAWSIASLVEYLIWGSGAAGPGGFLSSRLLSSVIMPWIMFIIWYTAPAFYGKPMPTVVAEIIYANIAILMIGAILALLETNLVTVAFTGPITIILGICWVLGMLEMVIFTFRPPWADFFRP